MQFGVTMFPTHDAIDPVSLGRAAEERGFESLTFPEHTHIPVSRRSPYPGGGELPREYVHTYDPFVALTAVATATERLLVGTSVCLGVERDPIVTAKEVASVDRLSGGRFLFGVGAGWNREEMENHGTDARTRMELLAERMHAMSEIWTADEAEFHGRYVDFDPIWSWPKPVQVPHPPVLVGGMGPTVEDRVFDFGDEWMPQGVTEHNIDEFAQRVQRLQQRAADVGRDAVPIT
ncbi:MAG TPA: LLM class F420-dependent oxidoreductase, partial [Pseudonocardiaceae bacterium]|nr:LLM class F420-dependent oxidoreductase [Pseudonocardiaceae bacterium]